MIYRFVRTVVFGLAFLAGLLGVGNIAAPTAEQGRVRMMRRDKRAGRSLAKRRRWFAGPLIKENWADLLEPGIREWFLLGQQRRPSLIPTLFDVISSTKDAEHFRGVGAVSPDAWELFSKTGSVPSVGFDQGYKSTFRHTTYLVELPIQMELIEDAQYANVIDAAMELGDSAQLKREVDAASIFNNAFSSTFAGPDGVALCSDSHPNGPTVSGVQDNNFTLPLNKTNVRAMREAMMAYKDDRGNLVAVTPNALIVPPALEDDAIEIAMSLLDPTSGNNAVNAQYGRFQVIPWHYLTDSNAWFMVDTMLMKRHLKWIDRVALGIELDRVEKKAYAVYIARMRYSYGWRDWRWVAGSNPS